MKGKERRFDIVGDKVYHSYQENYKKENGIYIKLPHEGKSGYGDVIQEYHSYKLISPYLRMPNIRLLTSKEGEKVLAVQKVLGESMGDLFFKDPHKAFVSLTNYANDLNMMWRNSVRKMDKSLLPIDKQLAFTDKVESYLAYSDAKEFLNAGSIIVNGVMYTDLVDKLNKILENLKLKSDPIMTLGHGDDHLGNILNDGNGGYYIIDPKLSGYYSPVDSYLNTALYLLLYKYNFIVKKENYSGEVVINYHLNGNSTTSLKDMAEILKLMENNISALSSNSFLIREFCVANLLRFVQGLNDPKNYSHTKINTMAYLGIAIELANGKFKNISELYEKLS